MGVVNQNFFDYGIVEGLQAVYLTGGLNFSAVADITNLSGVFEIPDSFTINGENYPVVGILGELQQTHGTQTLKNNINNKIKTTITKLILPSTLQYIGEDIEHPLILEIFEILEEISFEDTPENLTSIRIQLSQSSDNPYSLTKFNAKNNEDNICNIPNGCALWDGGSFSGQFYTINIPSSLIAIDNFLADSPIFNINVDENNPIFQSIDNCLIKPSTQELYIIGLNSKNRLNGLTNIKIIKYAFDVAFAAAFDFFSFDENGYCEEEDISLLTFDLPNTVEIIEEYASFSYLLPRNSSIIFPDSIQSCLSVLYFYVGEEEFLNLQIGENLQNCIFRFYNLEETQFINSIFINLNNQYYETDITEKLLIDKQEQGIIFCAYTTQIIIPNTIKSFKSFAFNDHPEIAQVLFEENSQLMNIGDYAFEGCTSLISITIPNSVTSIGYKAFSDCTSLTNITLGNSVMSIGQDSFLRCRGLTSIEIPNSVMSIGMWAFHYCTNLNIVYITDLVAWCNINFQNPYSNPLSCAHKLYLNNELITNLIIPTNITALKDYAFYSCTSLTSVTIPNSVTSIGDQVFYGCTGLTNIVTSLSLSLRGINFLTSLTINAPDVTITGDRSQSNLITININADNCTLSNFNVENYKTIEEIHINGYNCTLSSFVGPDTAAEGEVQKYLNFYVPSIDYWCDINFNGLNGYGINGTNKNLYINNEEATSETEIIIPKEVKYIKQYVFSGDSKDNRAPFNNIKFENDTQIERIAMNAFTYSELFYPRGVKKYPDYLDNESGQHIIKCKAEDRDPISGKYVIPETIQVYYPECFSGNNDITNEDIVDILSMPKIKVVSWKLFYNCNSENLIKIEIPNNIILIEEQAFANCYNIEEIIIGDGCQEIGYQAFNLTDTDPRRSKQNKLTLGKKLKYIDSTAFDDVYNLTELHIPSINILFVPGVNSIMINGHYNKRTAEGRGPVIYINNEPLPRVLQLPSGIVSIPKSILYAQESVKQINIPNSVKTIGAEAFAYSGIEKIYYQGFEKDWKAITKQSEWDRNMNPYTMQFWRGTVYQFTL